MPRLFTAIEIPRDAALCLSFLRGGLPSARWIDTENYHLTLRFIGAIERWRAEEVDEALAAIRARPFDLSLCGVGTFEKAGRIQSLWVGVERTEALSHLQAKVETALQRVGLEPERRRFAPHITLARVDRAEVPKLISYVQAHNLFRAPPVRMEQFTLFSSLLGKEHSVYTPEVEYALA